MIKSFKMDADIQKFIDDQRKPNTVMSTAQHVAKLKKYLVVEREELREIYHIDAPELNSYLSEFFYLLKKSETEDYEPSSIHNIKGAIDRHLRENYYAHSIMTDKEFERTRQVINAKCVSVFFQCSKRFFYKISLFCNRSILSGNRSIWQNTDRPFLLRIVKEKLSVYAIK